jgi:hypothetical protein
MATPQTDTPPNLWRKPRKVMASPQSSAKKKRETDLIYDILYPVHRRCFPVVLLALHATIVGPMAQILGRYPQLALPSGLHLPLPLPLPLLVPNVPELPETMETSSGGESEG